MKKMGLGQMSGEEVCSSAALDQPDRVDCSKIRETFRGVSKLCSPAMLGVKATTYSLTKSSRPLTPVKTSLTGTRPARSFIEPFVNASPMNGSIFAAQSPINVAAAQQIINNGKAKTILFSILSPFPQPCSGLNGIFTPTLCLGFGRKFNLTAPTIVELHKSTRKSAAFGRKYSAMNLSFSVAKASIRVKPFASSAICFMRYFLISWNPLRAVLTEA